MALLSIQRSGGSAHEDAPPLPHIWLLSGRPWPHLFVNGLIFIGVVWPLSAMVPTWTAATRHFFTFLLFVCMCTFCGHTLAAVAPTFEVPPVSEPPPTPN